MDNDQVRKLLSALELGAPIGTAIANAGVGRTAYDNWRKKTIGADEMINAAQSRSMLGPLTAMHEAYESGVWQAAAWLLERRHAEHFGKVDRLRIDGLSEYAESMAQRIGIDDAELLGEAEELAAEYMVLGRVENAENARKDPS